MLPKLSIIVPAYKVENYLEKCLNSIKSQTFSDFECIVVNDGSPDKSGEIADKFHNEDERFVVIHQENMGLSDARNNALKIAKGRLIGFVDSDDWVMPVMFEKLISALENSDADIVMCNYLSTKVGTNYKFNIGRDIIEYSAKEFTSEILKDNIGSQLWKFVYKRELWNGIISPSRRHFEDMMTLYKVTDRAKKVVVIEDKLYRYNDERENNISNSIKNRTKNVVDRTLAFWWRLDFCEENNYPEEVKIVNVNKAIASTINSYFDNSIFDDKYESDVEEIRKYIRKYKAFIKKYCTRTDYKVRIIMIVKCPHIYIKVYCLLNKICRSNRNKVG